MPLDDEQIEKVFESADRNKARSAATPFQVDFYWLRLLLLHHVGCIEPGLVTSLSCVFEAFRNFLYPFSIQLQDGKLTYEEYMKLVMLGL